MSQKSALDLNQACDIDFAVNQAMLFAEIFIELEICRLEA